MIWLMRAEAAHLRNLASKLAPKDWAAAVAKAEQITDPWYACQAYAWCGRYAPAAESGRLIETAWRRSRKGKDAYQQLAATAWPLRALLELKRDEEAARLFTAVAGLAGEIRPPSSRAEACYLVFQAAALGPSHLATRALGLLLTAVQPVEHWRQARAAREAVIEAVTLGLVDAAEVGRLVKDDQLAARIAARLLQGERGVPRAFFWTERRRAGE